MTGTLTLADLLSRRDTTVSQLPADKVVAAVRAHLDTHNRLARDGVSSYCQLVSVERMMDGLAQDGDMTEVDEFAKVVTEIAETEGIEVAFPLRKYESAIGWTQEHLDSTTPEDLALQVMRIERGDTKEIVRQIKMAIYTPIARLFRDKHDTKATLKVQPFLNGDGEAIPAGPNGEEFDPDTHTHFLRGPLTAANVNALITHVREHGHSKDLKLVIDGAQEQGFRDLEGEGFYAYPPAGVTLGANAAYANGTLDQSNTGNRAIGLINGAQVVVKPTAVAGYVFCYDAGAAADQKPLAFREPRQPGRRGLRTVAENALYPLIARIMQHMFGVGVRCRTNGAVLQVAADGAYEAPNIP
jgi:hypothetical protein